MGREFHLRCSNLFLTLQLLNEHLFLDASIFSFATIGQMSNGGIKGQLATLHSGRKQWFGGNFGISWVGME